MQDRSVRLILDLARRPDGGLEGEITRPGASALSFSGWLELLRALETATGNQEE